MERELIADLRKVLDSERHQLAQTPVDYVALHSLAATEARLMDTLKAIWRGRKDYREVE